MKIPEPNSIAFDICKALNIANPETVRYISIEIKVDSIVEVELVRYLKTTQGDALVEVLEDYILTPKLFPPGVDDH